MTTTVEYFWIPGVTHEELGSRISMTRRIPMERKPKRVQTVLHGVEGVTPDITHPQHRVTVFYEDYTHDWDWRGGVFHYSTRVVEATDGTWIRCEFVD